MKETKTKMTRQQMEQTILFVHEIRSIENALKSPKSAYVNVFYKDYRTGRAVNKSISEFDGGMEQIRILTGSLKAYKKKLAEQVVKAEKFIESVNDSEIRTILRMYYLNGNTQEEIGEELHYTCSAISRKLTRFWKSEELKKG